MKIGFACGIFDLFHAGHVLMLKECREHCDYLIVALNSAENLNEHINPGKSQPIFSLDERKLIVSSCKYVDEVLTYSAEEELVRLLIDRKVDIRFLGADYKNLPITGEGLPIELYYTDRSHGLSTSAYLKKIRNGSIL